MQATTLHGNDGSSVNKGATEMFFMSEVGPEYGLSADNWYLSVAFILNVLHPFL